MNASEFPFAFRFVLVVFLAELALVQVVTFRVLAGVGADPARRESRHVRDHVVAALLRAAVPGLAVAAVGTLAWALTGGGTGTAALLWGAQFFLASLLLALGLAALAARFSLQALERGPGRGRVYAVRASVLAAGLLYAISLWVRGRAGPGEHLLAFFLLGAALLVLGLNRLAGLSPASLERLAAAEGPGDGSGD